MISGKSDFATFGEFVAADKIMGGHDLCVIASISRFNTIRVVALKEKINTPDDIRGKRVALVAYSQAHFCLANFLLTHGIADSEVEIVNIEPDLMVQALRNGQVSAAVVWEPFASQMVAELGGNVTSWNAQTNYDLHFILAAHKDTLRNRPEITNKLLKSLYRAESFIAENNVAARDLTERAIKLGTGKAAQTDITWSLNDFGLRLDQALLVEMESGARWISRIKRNGATIPNLLNFICDGPLRALFPGTVSLIR
jgi:ABC-type nitrate/sulfonate/bicarbonate transport system substrate-binding protein